MVQRYATPDTQGGSAAGAFCLQFSGIFWWKEKMWTQDKTPSYPICKVDKKTAKAAPLHAKRTLVGK
jgi:hypothetical protein